ncbi:diguanylate cyclase [Vibrio parahaemolyticus 3324]|uniref:sensor domain-containing diguanylate cyclase n=1 Tax=Vibrio parahaemolyticus TaxID=670 RepID=UPI0005B6F030|nr:GGDEF domain-containing protein [Vibrio parahaemolyticus]KIT02730.1 diguanylate cyclase [Vibrio parahaemolyticus 3324]
MIYKERETWLEAILNTLPDHVFILDESGRYIESFGGTHHSKTFNAERYTGLQLSDVLSPTKADELMGFIFDVMQDNETKVVKYNLSLHDHLTMQDNETKVVKYNLSLHDHLLLPIEELEALENPEEMWFEAIIKPVNAPENANKLVIWSVRDITKTHLLEQRLKQLSETDALTGLLNRRAFISNLDNAIIQHTKRSKTLSCLMIDIDHFKDINDRVGHFSGDHVITRIAHVCQGVIRGSDFIGRLGGEEFAVILTDTNAIQAYEVAERIRQAIQATICHVDDVEITTTVSIGVAELNSQQSNAKELLIEADKAMYYSKHSGRNQVTLAYENLPDLKLYQTGHLKIQRVS